MKKITLWLTLIILVIVLVLILFIFNSSIDPESIAKENSEVNEFLNKYPQAQFSSEKYSAYDSLELTSELNKCSKLISAKEMYRFEFKDLLEEASAVGFIDSKAKKVDCVLISEPSSGENQEYQEPQDSGNSDVFSVVACETHGGKAYKIEEGYRCEGITEKICLGFSNPTYINDTQTCYFN